MPALLARISTIVRTFARLALLRLGFRLVAMLRPEAAIARAGVLFSTPFGNTRERALQAADAGAEHGVLDIDGHRIATYVWGDPREQPYVLLAHGWSSHGTRFLPWIPRLREAGYAVVAFDQPAHGRSDGRRTTLPDFARTLSGVASRFGSAAAVVGHSLGGAAATVALARGLPAERAILIAPAADPVDAALRFARLIRLPERLCRRMIASFEQSVGMSFAELQAQHNAPLIARPALIVHDVEDREVPWSEGERYARCWPGARLLSTQGLGHNRIAGDDGVIAAALRFLRGEDVGERVVSSPNLPYGFA